MRAEGVHALIARARALSWALLGGAAVFSVVALTAFLGALPANAATTHNFSAKLTEAPPGTPMKEPGPATVERATGQIFMTDPGAGVIDVFSATGTFLTQFGEGLEPTGVAVDEATGDIYVASANTLLVFKPNATGGYALFSEWEGANTPAKEFGELKGVAVDNSKGPNAGDIYVLDGSNNVVELFQPKSPGPEEAKEGAFLQSLKANLEEPNALAMDASTGELYVADSPKGFVDVFSDTGSFETKLKGAGSPQGSFAGTEGEEGNVRALAAEAGDLYVAEAERHVVSEFDSAGKWIGWVTQTPQGPFQEPDGVALAPSGAVFIADALADQLDIFGPGVIVPDAQTNPASKIGKVSAFLNGIVDGDGKAARYHFEWGPDEAYGQTTPTQSAGTGEEEIKAELTGLQAGQRYHFRLVSENENGTNVGADREFETLPAVDGVTTGPVQGLAPSEATLTGSLSPNGTDAHYLFEWGTTTAYGSSSPSSDAGSGKESVEAKATLQGLSPNTTYHYHLVGTNTFGTTQGADAHFTTSGPPQITPEPTTAITHDAATLNVKLDPGELETTYRFQYGTTTAYGLETTAGKLAPGEAFQPVSAALSALRIGNVYHFRLLAENVAGKTVEPDQSFETVPPAPIEDTSAREVSASSAEFEAQINPLGHASTVYIQYGSQPCKPDPAYCTDVPLPPGKDIGAGEAPVPVTETVEALTPSTSYHYRFLATNSLGTSEGPERTITTQAAETPFALVDNRAWEMVSPPNKHGAPIEALTREGGLILAAEDGNSITYVADGSIVEEPQAQRSPEVQQDISRRTPGGWTTEDIVTPNATAEGINGGNAPEYQYFSPELSQALVQPVGAEPALSPEGRQKTIYLRENSTGTYLPLLTETNVPLGTHYAGAVHFVAATPDLSHVILQSAVALGPSPSAPGLYEWSSGELQFVSLLPDRTPSPVASLGFEGHVLANAVSSDGSRAIWSNTAEGTGQGHLYMTDTSTGKTIQLDAAQAVSEPEGGSAQFQTASADGSKVFFTDEQKLTPDSTAQASFPQQADLYECEVAEEAAGKLACELKDLTVDPQEGGHAGVKGFLFGASEDGADLYLVAQGVLASNENGNEETSEVGKDNLYWLHFDGVSWHTTFIAQLSDEDAAEWEGARLADTAYLTARASPNGRYLAFMSLASPTGYDNLDDASGKPDEEVYLYDSATASLTCVSCNSTGARPHGVFDTLESGEGLGLVVDRRRIWGERGHEHWLAGNIPGWTAQSLVSALFQSRYLSNEGRLFFNSPDYLVPQAKSGKESVYEYEPARVGSCESATGGCVSLVSSGSSKRESAFLEATPSGNDVFFLNAAQLLPQDTDTAFDIYDARVCTQASPCLTPPIPAPPGCSEADACRPSEASQQAPLGALGSATVTAQGSLAPQPHGKQRQAGSKSSSKPHTTRAEELAKALKACKKVKRHKKRAKCQAQARKEWGAMTITKVNAKKTGRRASRGRR